MRRIFTLFILFSFLSSWSQTFNKNYTLTIEPVTQLTVNDYETSNFDVNNTLIESISYFDGFGINNQTILRKRNPQQKNIVKIFDYDEFGRDSKDFFPFYANENNLEFVDNGFIKQFQYYDGRFSDETPFTQAVYDNSPLNRIVKLSKGGDIRKIITNSNADKTVKLVPGTNLANEVKLNHVNNAGQLISNSYYAPSTLLKSVTKNENWISSDGNKNTIQIFTDDSGRKISELTMISDENSNVEKVATQYAYDQKGLLRYILSPQYYNFDAQSYYDNQTLKFSYKKFLIDETVEGGGADVIVTIDSGILSVIFSAGYNSSKLKSGQIVFLDSRIPNVDLGAINCTPCNGNYRLFVERGFLSIEIVTTGIETTHISGTHTAAVLLPQNFIFQSPKNMLDKYAYQYIYDDYGRLIEQKAPGKEWEYSVFDHFDRPVITQDFNLRTAGSWLFTKYDVYGRVVYTGVLTNGQSRASLQQDLDNFYDDSSNNPNFEHRLNSAIVTGGMDINYSNNTFPIDNINISSITYYDDYEFIDEDKPSTPSTIYGQLINPNSNGLTTCSIRKTIGENSFSKTFVYYDNNALPIFSYSKNFKGGYTITETKYDFRGKKEFCKTSHKKDTSVLSEIVIEDRWIYDHAERLIAEYKKINSQPEESVAQYVYNDIGILDHIKVGGLTTASLPLQSITFESDILGQLRKINNPANLGSSLFAFELKYESPDDPATALYNGNISQTVWKSAVPGTGEKKYSYSYDKLNRLKTATFSNSLAPSNDTSYFEKLNYDLNGNITLLNRSGNTANQANFEWVDALEFSYDGNQLLKIQESGDLNVGYLADAANNLVNTFEYDANGNLIKDRNKGIENITYNYLNLVDQITFVNGKEIKFLYDASGTKISKQFITSTGITTTEYIDGFQYLNNELQFFSTSQGYVFNTSGSYKYVYLFKDHLGNNRLSYCDLDSNGAITNSEILSSTDYYPFGTVHSGEFVNGSASAFLYKFQGKELNNEENLKLFDFGSRLYDPSICRWMSPDPQNQFVSPYVAFGNNPVSSIDPDGEYAIWDDVAVFLIGGTVNVVSNAMQGKVNSWGDGFAYFGAGGAAGVATIYAGPIVGAAVLGVLNNTYDQYAANGNSFNNFDYGQVVVAAATSSVSAWAGGALSTQLNGYIATMFNKVPYVGEYLTDMTANAGTGFIMGTGGALISGSNFEEALKVGYSTAGNAAVTSVVSRAGGQIKSSMTKPQQDKAALSKASQSKINQAMTDLETEIASDVIKAQKSAVDKASMLMQNNAKGRALEDALNMPISKKAIYFDGRRRFPDRLGDGLLEEAKNVSHLNYTRQLRDYYNYSQKNNLQMILYTGYSTTFSSHLKFMLDSRAIIHIRVEGF